MVAAFLNAVKSSMSCAQYLQWSELGERLSQIRTLSWQLWPLSAIIARTDVYHLHEKRNDEPNVGGRRESAPSACFSQSSRV